MSAEAERAGRAAVADLQRPGGDRRRPGVGVGAGEDGRSGAGIDQRAAAADGIGERHRVAAVEAERAVVDDRASAMLPVVPPLPICNVPALIVVAPV